MELKSYLTVEKQGEDEFVERKSRFISVAVPVTTEQQALDFIASRRSQYWDATHNVYAYVLRDGGIRRFSDDAEPQGTAGMPTLDVLVKSDVTDVCVVTTRYFGGVLLGAGGLVRAYSHSASIALQSAGIVKMQPVHDCFADIDYHMYGKLNSVLAQCGALDINAQFSDTVKLTFCIPFEELEGLRHSVTDASSGSVKVDFVGQHYAMIKI